MFIENKRIEVNKKTANFIDCILPQRRGRRRVFEGELTGVKGIKSDI
jgi:hypothetical protein